MPRINVNGTRVNVDDSFLSLSPEDQNATIDEIAGSLPKQTALGRGASNLGKAYQSVVGENIGLMRQGLSEMRAPPSPEDVPSYERVPAVAPFAKAALGAVGYATAPIGALSRNAAQRTEEATGIPAAITEPLLNVAAGGVLPAIGRGLVSAYRAVRPIKAVVPSTEELLKSGSAGFEAPEVQSVQIDPKKIEYFYTTLPKAIRSDAKVTPRLAGETYGTVDDFAKEAATTSEPLTIGDLREQRQIFQRVSQSNIGPFGNVHEKRAADAAMRKIDDLLERNLSSVAISGEPEAAGRTLERARETYAAGKSAEALDVQQFRKELRAASANSGMNVGNSMRQGMADILVNPKLAQKFSASERALMERIVYGTPTENATRWAANLGGGGGGLGSTVARDVGVRLLGPAGGLVPEMARGLKVLSNRMTVNNVRKLNEIVRSDSPLAREVAAALEQWQTTQAAAQQGGANAGVQAQIAANNLAIQLDRAGIRFSPAIAEPEQPSD